ncbi:MAG TPA: uracil-DNA glycosylase [Longimicrobium sp.]|jgi:uracil-DNA glycosylase family 4
MSLKVIESEVVACRRCPRLVEWRERVGREKRRAYRDQEYWARPIPGFGDPAARLLVLGLAPAAHGGNRTGRVFTGDRSGDWLYAALHRAGFANQPTSSHVGDGLAVTGAWITAAVKCAPPDNKPLPDERDACFPFARRELEALPELRAIVCLGKFAWDGALRLLREAGHPPPVPLPKFGHGAQARVGPYTLIGSYHPSQQNTFTGRLTEPMLNAVFAAARRAVSD